MTYHETPHTVPYTRAMAFIASHGHFAAITKDGLLAMSDVCYCPNLGGNLETITGHADDDRWYEEPHIFPVDADGRVSSRAVRDWLGY